MGIIEQKARNAGVWDYINPKLDATNRLINEVPSKPDPSSVKGEVACTNADGSASRRPPKFGDLSAEEQGELKELREDWRQEEKAYNRRKILLGNVYDYIIETVDIKWVRVFSQEPDVWSMLRKLHAQFAPTAAYTEGNIIQKWADLSTNDQAIRDAAKDLDKLDEWLNEWSVTFAEGQQEKVSETTNHNSATRKFARAIPPISDFWARQLTDRVAKEEDFDFPAILRQFRIFKHSEVQLRPTRGRHGAFVAGKHNDEEDDMGNSRSPNPSWNGKDKDGKSRTCLCGSNHSWSKCYYITPEIAPPTFTPRDEIMEEVNRKIKANPRVKSAVTSIRATHKAKAGKQQIRGSMEANKDQQTPTTS